MNQFKYIFILKETLAVPVKFLNQLNSKINGIQAALKNKAQNQAISNENDVNEIIKIKCPICSQTFPTTRGLQLHLTKTHMINSKFN